LTKNVKSRDCSDQGPGKVDLKQVIAVTFE